MAGSQQYKNIEIHYVLKAIQMGMPSEWIRMRFEQRFRRKLTENQLRYLKNKYGRDPRFGTPAANSISTFGTPNPRVGPGYWPNDDILAIDYRAFEERREDVAEPTLRITAPITTHVVVPPTPAAAAPHPPAPVSSGPESLELFAVPNAHTIPKTDQRRPPETNDQVIGDGSTESPLLNLDNASGADVLVSYERNARGQAHSTDFGTTSPVYDQSRMLSLNAALPPPPPPAAIPYPPPFRVSGPMHNQGFRQEAWMPGNPLTNAPLPMSEVVSSNGYNAVPAPQLNGNAGLSSSVEHNFPNNMTSAPFHQPSHNFTSNAGFGQNTFGGIDPGFDYVQGASKVGNAFNKSHTMQTSWDTHDDVVNLPIGPPNSASYFTGLSDTPQLGSQGYTPHDNLENLPMFSTVFNTRQTGTSLSPTNHQISQDIQFSGPNDHANLVSSVGEPAAMPDTLNLELSHLTGEEFAGAMYALFNEHNAVHDTGPNAFNMSLDVPSSPSNSNTSSVPRSISTPMSTPPAEVLERTDISGHDRPTTTQSAST